MNNLRIAGSALFASPANAARVTKLCNEASEHGLRAVCVNLCYFHQGEVRRIGTSAGSALLGD